MPARKVLLLIDSLESGGAQRQIVVLAKVLRQLGYDVGIVTHYPGDQLSHLLTDQRIRILHVPRHSRYDLGFLLRLRHLLRTERPDCIISYLTTTNFWARIAGFLAGVPRVITSERSATLAGGRLATLRERWLSRLSSVIVVNSHAARQNLIRAGLPAGRIAVIYNGLDCEHFRRQPADAAQDLRTSLGITDREPLVLLPGRMSAEKNHVLLVDAIERISANHPCVRVAFAGNEFYADVRQAVVARIAACPVPARYLLLGARSDMPLLYSAADLVVLPSLWEGFPNVLVEAMACGTPVVASDIGDNAHIITDRVTGRLFTSNDAVSLAGALDDLLRLSAEERRAMGQRGASRARELCSLDTFGARYRELIEGRMPAPAG